MRLVQNDVSVSTRTTFAVSFFTENNLFLFNRAIKSSKICPKGEPEFLQNLFTILIRARIFWWNDAVILVEALAFV